MSLTTALDRREEPPLAVNYRLSAEARRRRRDETFRSIADGVNLARDLRVLRARRDRAFGKDTQISREPAWLILLELYVRASTGERTAIGDAQRASGVPSATALRYINALEAAALVERRPDPKDERRTFLALTEAAITLLDRCLGVDGREDA